MRAKDVMTANVVTVTPDTDVRTLAQCLIERRISAVPVVDEGGRVVGIVSEGDLMRRAEIGTECDPASWWRELVGDSEKKARAYAKTHGLVASDVMSRDVVTVGEDTSLGAIATLFEGHRIKRVPVVRDGAIVGIVSRANLLQGLIAKEPVPTVAPDDAGIQGHIMVGMKEAGISGAFLNIVVADGIVDIWGHVPSEAAKEAIRIAAETAPGVKAVESKVRVGAYPQMAAGWA